MHPGSWAACALGLGSFRGMLESIICGCKVVRVSRLANFAAVAQASAMPHCRDAPASTPTGTEKRGTAKNHCQRDSRPHTQEAERRNEAKRIMSIQGSQLAPAGEHQEHHRAPPGKHHEHHRGHVSPLEGRFGTHPLEPKKGPARGTPKSLHSTGIGCKNGPGVATCWGGPPPHTP